jgi:hypothetical protein
MEPLLGFLGASVVAAVIGTTLKGIIRPLSWAMLAGVALLFGSSKVVDATNALTQSPESTPSPTLPLTSNATAGVPPVAQGWQAAASGLDPALSPVYGQGQIGQGQGQFGQGQVGQGQVGQGQSGQGQVGQGQFGQGQSGQLNRPAEPVVSAPTPQPPPPRVSSQPIAGLW